jgi:hypothetical protein
VESAQRYAFVYGFAHGIRAALVAFPSAIHFCHWVMASALPNKMQRTGATGFSLVFVAHEGLS